MPVPSSTRATLSRPAVGGGAERGARAPSAGLSRRRPRRRRSASAWSSSSATSTPASAAGHQPERGQRAVPAADVRVGQDHRARPSRAAVASSGEPGSVTDDEVPADVARHPGVHERLPVGPPVAVGLHRASRTCWTPPRRCAPAGRRAPRATCCGSVVSSTVSATPERCGRSPRAPATSRPSRRARRGRAVAPARRAAAASRGSSSRLRRKVSTQPSRISASGSASGPHSVGSFGGQQAAARRLGRCRPRRDAPARPRRQPCSSPAATASARSCRLDRALPAASS